MSRKSAVNRKKSRKSSGFKKGIVALILVFAVFMAAMATVTKIYVNMVHDPVYKLSESKSFFDVYEMFKDKKKAEKIGLVFYKETEASSEELKASAFASESSKVANELALADGVDPELLSKPGYYDVGILYGGSEYTCHIMIQDTVAPKATTKNVTIKKGESISPQDLIREIDDETECTVTFYNGEPDVSSGGVKDVSILIEDKGGNKTVVDTKLNVSADEIPPVIEGAEDKTIVMGDTVKYRDGVSVSDNKDANVVLNIDTSAVNVTQPGSYPVIYWAEDESGNRAEVTVTYTFEYAPNHTGMTTPFDPGDADLDELTEEVYLQITTEEMSKIEKAREIYDWCGNNIAYLGNADKSNWEIGAIEGFVNRGGDCFTYYSCAKALLQRAGYETLDVIKHYEEGRSMHYWLLVYIDDGSKAEGWYHFDACPRTAGGDFFMLTDSEMFDYSEEHDDCFDFNLNDYPRTPGELSQERLERYSY